jgi:hypothetical protein
MEQQTGWHEDKQEMYIQSPKVAEKIQTLTGKDVPVPEDYKRKTPPMHKTEGGVPAKSRTQESTQSQTTRQVPPKQWMSESEREDRITLQSVLARSVEIVNAHYLHFPSSLNKSEFTDSLSTRCDQIEGVADRLFAYSKKKVEEGREKEK